MRRVLDPDDHDRNEWVTEEIIEHAWLTIDIEVLWK
jgi:hypothetical protein